MTLTTDPESQLQATGHESEAEEFPCIECGVSTDRACSCCHDPCCWSCIAGFICPACEADEL